MSTPTPAEVLEADRPDLRLLPSAVAAWLAALAVVALPVRLGLALTAVLAATAGALGVWLRRRRGARRGTALVLLAAGTCAAAAAGSAVARVATLHSGPLPGLAEQRAVATVDLVVTSDPRARRPAAGVPGVEGVVLRARVEQVQARGEVFGTRLPVVVLAADDGWAGLLPSQHVRATVRLAPAEPDADVTALLDARGPPTEVGPPSLLQRVAARLRAGLRDSVAALPPDPRGLVPGLVVGDTTNLPADLEEDFRRAGLTHLVAVSGANVAVVLAAVLLTARWVGLRARAVPLAGVLGLAGFVVLARPEPSVLRATVMGLVAVVALTRGGRRRGLPALSAAVLLLVLVDPFLARSAGFALSVLATAGLLVLAPGWRTAFARVLPGRLADALAVPAAAQVAVAPVLVLLNPSVSLVSIPANLLAAPAVPPATVLGVVAAVTGPVAPWLAEVAGRLAGVPAAWIVLVGRAAAQTPGAALGWPTGLTGAVLLAGLLLVLGLSAPALRRHRGWTAGVLVVLLVAASPLGVRPRWPPPGWVAVVCDVGQGDAVVLAAGPASAVVVDAGPDPDAVDRCLRDLGVRRVPLVVLTHFHADHVEGLPGVLRGRAVGAVEVSPLAEPDDEAARVRGWAAAAGVPLAPASLDEQRVVGPLSWRVLWPARLIRGEGSAPNNASVVLRVETAGTVLLLSGDVELAAQQALLARPELLRADVLKVAHHGSRVQVAAFIEAVGARAALVSVGADNGYGHPARSTLDLAAANGALVLRTDEHGDLAVVGGSPRVVPRR